MTSARAVALPATRRPQSRGYLAAGLAAVVRRSHPHLETPASAAAVHDLYRRLGPDDDPAAVLAADIVDAAAPVASLAAGSEIVALAREAAAAGEGRWTPDDDEPEASFAALVTAAAGGKGSGWLEWESHDGAGSVRADPIVMLTAHLAASGVQRKRPTRFVIPAGSASFDLKHNLGCHRTQDTGGGRCA